MRWMVLLLMFSSIITYAKSYNPGGPNIPCVPSDMEGAEYILCPTLTTIAIPLITIVAPTVGTMHTVDSTNKKNKIIINSKAHAASYIASDCKINSVYLEQVLVMLRKQYPNTSDMELAEAILAY